MTPETQKQPAKKLRNFRLSDDDMALLQTNAKRLGYSTPVKFLRHLIRSHAATATKGGES